MNDEQVDAAIRAAFAALEPNPETLETLAPRRRYGRFEAVAVGLVATAALALFIPWMLRVEIPRALPDAAPAYAPPVDTRVVRLDVAGAQDGWPTAGSRVDVYAADGESGVTVLLTDVPVVEAATSGAVAVAVDPALAVRAVHGGQLAALSLGVVLPDGRRVVELRESSPVAVGDVVDVIVTGQRNGKLETWTALRGLEVVTLGRDGPMVALAAKDALEAVAVQRRGVIRLSRHLDGGHR